MLAEMILYLALFAALFSGAFSALFQSIDALNYLEQRKEVIDGQYFLMARLDAWLQTSDNWVILPDQKLQFNKRSESVSNSYVLSAESGVLILTCLDCPKSFKQSLSGFNLKIENFLPQITTSATSSARLLNISLEVNKTTYLFSYYAE